MFSLLQLKQLAIRLSRAPVLTMTTLITLPIGIGTVENSNTWPD